MGELGPCPELFSACKALDYLSFTLKIGRSMKGNIETLCRETECVRVALHSESTDDDASERKKTIIISEITMLYTIRSTIEQLECCSRSLSHLFKELSSVPEYTKAKSYFPNKFSVSAPTKSEISNKGTESEIPNHLYSDSSRSGLISPEKSVLDEIFECDESLSKECKSQNTKFGAIMKPSKGPPSLILFESNMGKSVIDINEKNTDLNPRSTLSFASGSKMECVSECCANELSSKNSTSSPFTLPKGWVRRREIQIALGIEVDKCSTCGRFKRSSRKGRYKGRCRCIKRSKEAQVTTVTIPCTSENSIPDDGYTWRKYGQKVTKPGSFPRAYFKCTTSKKCSAKRHTERDNENSDMIIVTYVGQHSH